MKIDSRNDGVEFVLTVPHAVCAYSSFAEELQRRDQGGRAFSFYHLCDYSAQRSANRLKISLGARSDVRMFLSPEERNKMDYNRMGSRDSEWRKNLLKVAKEEKVKAVIDVHSFTPESAYPFPFHLHRNYELVILDSWTSGEGLDLFYLDPMSGRLKDHLLAHDVDAILLPGSENDIMLQMRENGIPSVLIEFNEYLSEARLGIVCDLLADFFKPKVAMQETMVFVNK